MKAGSFGQQRSRLKRYPALNAQQQRLVQDHMEVAQKVASIYYRRGAGVLDRDDLISIGYMAMCAVAPRYDPGKGKFATFAWAFVESWIRHAIRDQSRVVRLPRAVINNRGEVKKLLREEGLTYQAIADRMGISIQLVTECEQSWREETVEIQNQSLCQEDGNYFSYDQECRQLVESLSDRQIGLIHRYLDGVCLTDSERTEAAKLTGKLKEA